MGSDKDLPTSAPSSSASSSSAPTTDVSAHRSCKSCASRMSSVKYDKHTLCLNCRDVQCSLDVRCDECKNWSSDIMLDYLKHHNCSDTILTCRINIICSPAKVGLVVIDLITSPVVSWRGWETPPTSTAAQLSSGNYFQ